MAAWADLKPIERLKPGNGLHETMLDFLMSRLKMSERKMSRFYARWRAREKQIQAYIDLPNYEKQLKEMNESGAPPVITSITIPYSYATIATIATYLTHTFTGRKPLFNVASNSSQAAANAPHMETVLQYQADTRYMIKRFMQFFKDSETYAVGAMKCVWEVEKRKRTTWTQSGMGERVSKRELKTTYEGNDLENIDPFCFFPDPRVPMSEAPWRAEFIFWRDFIGMHELQIEKGDYGYQNLGGFGHMPQNEGATGVSARSMLVGGEAMPGQAKDNQTSNGLSFLQRDECTCWVIPSKIIDPKTKRALGDGVSPELWIFTVINKKIIIRAQPFEYDHGMHPIVTVEPHSVGYGFGHPSTADYLAPIQDAASWFLNTHIYNVRSFLNNMIVYNPALIEGKDLANPKPGKLIRLKRSAMGVDIRTAIFQLQQTDVTRGHISDLENVIKMGDMLSSVNDNLRGIQDSGSRKTATEVRTSGEAGASRLAAQARLYSAQGFSPLGMQMCLNTQQFLSSEMEMRIIGEDKVMMMGPDHLVGDYYFPIHDGTLPLDKVALVDIWKEILLGVTKDPELRTQFSVVKIFEWVAELGGARNISNFKNPPVNGAPGQPAGLAPVVAPPGFDPTNGMQAGNLIPLPGV
ncbi:MAG: hypothetical protein B7Z37_03145 [Verrucomicrobia bacterium 12-59-8]|nr:MAG: hypothetical protein B7Z37_03145 [Verrucomicrobia bacterium 12-59-8]